MRVASFPALVLVAQAVVVLAGSATGAHAEWRHPIEGASPLVPANLSFGDSPLTVHAAPPRPRPAQEGGNPLWRWSQPLTDRRLDPSQRAAPLDARLVEAIKRIEPIYDPTLLDGLLDVEPMHVSAGTAEMRDIFGDHWRIASADANVDADARPLAAAWTAGGAPRPCQAYRVRRRHEWNEPALSATTGADCRAILARQARGFADASLLPVAIAAPPVPVFAAPEPGSRMASADFWAAQRARIAGIRDHLHRKWAKPTRPPLRNAMN